MNFPPLHTNSLSLSLFSLTLSSLTFRVAVAEEDEHLASLAHESMQLVGEQLQPPAPPLPVLHSSSSHTQGEK